MKLDTSLGEMECEEIDEFVYLGVRVTSKAEKEKKIEERLSKGNESAGPKYHLLTAKQLSKSEKFVIDKTILRPTALYDCESWVINKNAQDIEKMGKKIIRRIVGGRRTE